MNNQVTISGNFHSKSGEYGTIDLSNGITIWWGLEYPDGPNTRSEALEIASFLCKALNDRES